MLSWGLRVGLIMWLSGGLDAAKQQLFITFHSTLLLNWKLAPNMSQAPKKMYTSNGQMLAR
jgi:hypothetical protein